MLGLVTNITLKNLNTQLKCYQNYIFNFDEKMFLSTYLNILCDTLKPGQIIL